MYGGIIMAPDIPWRKEAVQGSHQFLIVIDDDQIRTVLSVAPESDTLSVRTVAGGPRPAVLSFRPSRFQEHLGREEGTLVPTKDDPTPPEE